MRTQPIQPWLLLAPLLLFLLVMLIVPVGMMLSGALRQMDLATYRVLPGLSLVNLRRAMSDPFYVGLLLRTLRIAALVTLATLLLAYPAAFYLSRAGGRERNALMLLVTAPLLVSIVIRSFGWIILLGPRGVFNAVLIGLGITAAPLRLMYTETAVIAGMAQVYFPFMVLAVFAALDRVDRRLDDAAATLGAGPLRRFWRITLPLSAPGMVAGSLLVFALSISAFVTPAILGGPWVKMIGTVILQQATTVLDWPFAAALSTVLLVAAGLILLVYGRLAEPRLESAA